jgi:hypothetical protein
MHWWAQGSEPAGALLYTGVKMKRDPAASTIRCFLRLLFCSSHASDPTINLEKVNTRLVIDNLVGPLTYYERLGKVR